MSDCSTGTYEEKDNRLIFSDDNGRDKYYFEISGNEIALDSEKSFKTACAIFILSNTFNIVMAVFDVSQTVIAQAGGLIQGSTDITPDMMAELETTLEGMDLGPLLGLWLQSSLIGVTMWALGIVIFVLVYGRMLEIYLLTSLAPIPMATIR